MKNRVLKAWMRVRSSYWFVPTLMLVLAAGLSVVMVEIDQRYEDQLTETLGFVYGGGADGARGLLSTVAGSMITVAGVVFSITLVALSLASAQFGPRLLRNFMSDVPNQIVLGTFISSFLYCLLVLRTIRGGTEEDAVFIPELSVTVGVIFAVFGILVLVYFIHHVASSVQVENAIQGVGSQLERSVELLFPEDGDEGDRGWRSELNDEDDVPPELYTEAEPIVAPKGGYVQWMDTDALLAMASKEEVIIRVSARLGQFVPTAGEIAEVWPPDRLDDDMREAIVEKVSIGAERLQRLDVEFYITQLVEIAIRSLSPSMNDAFTAMSCIDQLGSVLAGLVRRERPVGYLYDDEGSLRLIGSRITFPAVLSMSFAMIRRNSAGQVAVCMRLLEVMAILAGLAERDEDRQAVYGEADMVMRVARESITAPSDLQEVSGRYQDVLRAMKMDLSESF